MRARRSNCIDRNFSAYCVTRKRADVGVWKSISISWKRGGGGGMFAGQGTLEVQSACLGIHKQKNSGKYGIGGAKEIPRNGEIWKADAGASKRGDNRSPGDVRTRRSNCRSQNFHVQTVYHGRGYDVGVRQQICIWRRSGCCLQATETMEVQYRARLSRNS
jgi:hypothetical protein